MNQTQQITHNLNHTQTSYLEILASGHAACRSSLSQTQLWSSYIATCNLAKKFVLSGFSVWNYYECVQLGPFERPYPLHNLNLVFVACQDVNFELLGSLVHCLYAKIHKKKVKLEIHINRPETWNFRRLFLYPWIHEDRIPKGITWIKPRFVMYNVWVSSGCRQPCTSLKSKKKESRKWKKIKLAISHTWRDVVL